MKKRSRLHSTAVRSLMISRDVTLLGGIANRSSSERGVILCEIERATKAPRARNAEAWANGPGRSKHSKSLALKARNYRWLKSRVGIEGFMPRLQRSKTLF